MVPEILCSRDFLKFLLRHAWLSVAASPPPFDSLVLLGSLPLKFVRIGYRDGNDTWLSRKGIPLPFQPDVWMPVPELPENA